MKITIDISELRTLAVDMGEVADEIKREIPAVVAKGAHNVKRDLTDKMKASTHFKGFADIGYDLLDGGMAAEIGPNKPGPGAGANLSYFGTSRGGGTVEDPMEALLREADKMRKALLDLLDKAL